MNPANYIQRNNKLNHLICQTDIVLQRQKIFLMQVTPLSAKADGTIKGEIHM